MQEREIAVKVQDLTKSFKIPLEASNGIKQKLINTLKGRKGYRDFTPINDISFEIEKGDFFGIVGRNGSGKSTLLKTIAGIYTPNKGAVHVNGTLVPFIELGVGFNPELTGRENVFLNGALLGFSHEEMEAMYDDIVEFAELEEFMDERLKNYSSGMQVRLAFSIAIRAEGDVLILDEVLAVGDEAFQRKCLQYFKQLKNQHKTVILVTHDMGSVREYCNKAILLEKGRIINFGSAKEVSLAYSELFRPSTNDEQVPTRWGNGAIEINKPHATATDKIVTVSADIKILKSIDPECVIGIAVKDEFGRSLQGYKESTGLLARKAAGDLLNLQYTFKNNLSAGRYTIDISFYSPILDEYYDCWIECTQFKSRREGIVGYPFISEDNLRVTSGKEAVRE